MEGLPGVAMDKVLVSGLGLSVGDRFRMGVKEFRLGCALREPDSANGGFSLGLRTIVRTADLAGSGLLEPGSLVQRRTLLLPAGTPIRRRRRGPRRNRR